MHRQYRFVDLLARYVSDRRRADGDMRSEFEHDRDRIVHSSALRRLQGKSQVLTANTTDFFRTRLTHTLECAQIGAAIAKRAADSTWHDHAPTHEDFICLVKSACLAHDLGHPPFGHNGENELRAVMQEWNGSQFEGNAQSFRVITFLEAKEFGLVENRVERWAGLNLTRGTLRAICKYPHVEGSVPAGKEKFNAYSDGLDAEYFSWVWEGVRTPQITLPAQMMDISDDIAYGAHDFEDGVWAGMIPLYDLVNEDDDAIGDLSERVLSRDEKRPANERAFMSGSITEPLRELLQPIKDSYWATRPFDRSKFSRRELKDFTSGLIGTLIDGVTPGRTFLPPTGRVKQWRDLLTGMAWVWMIDRPGLATTQYAQRRIIRRLFEGYWACPEMLPRRDEWDHVRTSSEPVHDKKTGTSRWPEKAILIRDHIAGMTDAYATAVYHDMHSDEHKPITAFSY